MRARRPHYFLRTQAAAPPAPPRWAFSLQAGDQSPPITAGDLEPNASWERLQLLAVVRGLEALPEPALVTLATASDVVRRGIKHGLEEWREFGWQLEHFGELIPVKNADLWRRIDRALVIHDVQIRNIRVDEPIVAEQNEQPHFAQSAGKSPRAQTALVGSGKLARGSESIAIDSNGGTTWSSDSFTKHESWQNTSPWHDQDYDDHDADHDAEDSPHGIAQLAGKVRIAAAARGNYAAKKPAANVRFSGTQSRPRYSFSLLRVRRRLRASRLHLMRRIGELWNSWVWFYEVSGLQQLTRTQKTPPPPWLRDQQSTENPRRY